MKYNRRTMPYVRCLLLVFSLSTAACCGESTSVEPGHNVADLELELTLGDIETAPREYLFASIESILALPDGTIWVLDGDGYSGQTPELRRYDFEGSYLGLVGRRGEGPGEYLAPYQLALTGDGRVALRDARLGDRITFYTADGVFDTTWSFQGGLSWPFNGGYAIQVDKSGAMWLPFREGVRLGPERSNAFLRVRPDGTVLDTISFPPIPEVDREHLQIIRTLPSGGTSIRGFRVPYQPGGTWTWSPFGNFAVARTDQYRIEVLPPPGVTDLGDRTVIAREVPAVPVPQDERIAARKKLADQVSAVEGGASLRIPQIPEYKPPIKYLDFSEEGRLLVSVSTPSRLQGEEWTESNAFDVFGLEGQFMGRVTLPDSFTMYRMRGDLMWGVFRGETWGIESIRRYRIVWPS